MGQLSQFEHALRLIVDASKDLVKAKRNSGVDSYIRGLWRAKTKQEAALSLPTASSLAQHLGVNISSIEDVLDHLVQNGLIYKADLGSDDGPHFLATFEAIASAQHPLGSLSDMAEEMGREMREVVNLSLRSESYVYFLESLTSETRLTAKMVVFGLFLVLSGAVSRASALRIEFNEGSKELEYLDALAQHLDDVSRALFPKSWGSTKGRNSGKTFRTGDLDDFLRRRKQMEQAVGPAVFVFDPPRYYFDLYGQGVEPEDKVTRALLEVLLGRVQELCSDAEWNPAHVRTLIRRYQYDSPIKVSHRQALFSSSPPDNWYFCLEYYVDEVLELNQGPGRHETGPLS